MDLALNNLDKVWYVMKTKLKQTSVPSGWDPTNKCPGYDTKKSDGEVPVMVELWEMRNTPSLPSLPGPILPGVVAADKALAMG